MTKWRKFKQDFVGGGGQASEIYCNLCRHQQVYSEKKCGRCSVLKLLKFFMFSSYKHNNFSCDKTGSPLAE